MGIRRTGSAPLWSRRRAALVPVGLAAFLAGGVLTKSAAAAQPRVLTFTGSRGEPPDPAVWNHEVGGGGWGNREVETYTDSSANASVDGDGRLVITGRRETATGEDKITRHYTSARITTAGKVPVQPGSYVETTIQAAVAEGVWPAFWLIGDDLTRVGWPACGELDVFETIGSSSGGSHSTAHLAERSDPTQPVSFSPPVTGRQQTGDGAHRYGVYFSGAVVRFFVDRIEEFHLSAAEALARGWSWPFGGSMYILLNLAVGGASGDPSNSVFPRTMTVDSISIWAGGVPF